MRIDGQKETNACVGALRRHSGRMLTAALALSLFGGCADDGSVEPVSELESRLVGESDGALTALADDQRAWVLNGTSDRARAVPKPAYDIGTGAFTLTVRAKRNGSATMPLASSRLAQGSGFLFLMTGNQLLLQLEGTNYTSLPMAELSDGKFHDFTVTRRGNGELKFYVDAQDRTPVTQTMLAFRVPGPLKFGHDSVDQSWFGGALTEARLFSRVLSQPELSGLQSSLGLVGRWVFSSRSRAEVPDFSALRNPAYFGELPIPRGAGASLVVDGASSIQGGVAQPNVLTGASLSSGLSGSGLTIPSGNVTSPYRIDFPNTGFSVSLWVRSNRVGGIDTILDQRTESAQGTRGFGIYTFNGQLGVQLSTGTVTNFDTGKPIADGNWHHVLVSLSPAGTERLKVYLDGYLARSFNAITVPSLLNTSAPLRLGARSWEGSGALGTLDIDDVYVYPNPATWERVAADSTQPRMSDPSGRTDTASDACSDILAQGIYEQLALHSTESTESTALAWACSEVKKKRNSEIALSIFDVLSVGYQTKSKDHEKWCQENYTNEVRDYTYDLQMETINPDVVQAWTACMIKESRDVACWPRPRQNGIALDITYDTVFGPTEVNLEYPTLNHVAPLGILPTKMGEGKVSLLFDVTSKPADVIVNAWAERGGPGSAIAQTSCQVNVPEDPPAPRCLKDTVTIKVDEVRITRGGDRGSRGDDRWYIEVDKTNDTAGPATFTDGVEYAGPYKPLFQDWQSPLDVPNLPKSWDIELDTSTTSCFTIKGIIEDTDGASQDESAETETAQYCWDPIAQEWSWVSGPQSGQESRASYDWFLETFFTWSVERTKCHD